MVLIIFYTHLFQEGFKSPEVSGYIEFPYDIYIEGCGFFGFPGPYDIVQEGITAYPVPFGLIMVLETFRLYRYDSASGYFLCFFADRLYIVTDHTGHTGGVDEYGSGIV